MMSPEQEWLDKTEQGHFNSKHRVKEIWLAIQHKLCMTPHEYLANLVTPEYCSNVADVLLFAKMVNQQLDTQVGQLASMTV